jgi:hypothetical protein
MARESIFRSVYYPNLFLLFIKINTTVKQHIDGVLSLLTRNREINRTMSYHGLLNPLIECGTNGNI